MTTPPGTSLEMLHAIGGLLAAEGPVEIGTMFRSPGLRTGTKIFAFLGHANPARVGGDSRTRQP